METGSHRDLNEGDDNTKYFHLKASRRGQRNYMVVFQNNCEDVI